MSLKPLLRLYAHVCGCVCVSCVLFLFNMVLFGDCLYVCVFSFETKREGNKVLELLHRPPVVDGLREQRATERSQLKVLL